MNEVSWLLPVGGASRAADRFAPTMGDRAILSFSLGYPLIIGFLPRLQLGDNTSPISLGAGQVVVDTGSYSSSNIAVLDQNKPQDIIAGDRVISSTGGSLLGLLRGGAVLLRASRGAEIFLSNFKNMIRIFSRNWVHITDLCTDIISNYKGKLFRYTGYSKTLNDSIAENYQLNFYYGQVSTAEAIKTNINGNTSPPGDTAILYKEQVLGPSIEYMKRTLDDNGNNVIHIQDGSNTTTITQNADQIVINCSNSNSTTTMNSTGTFIASQGHQIAITSSGVAIT